MKKTLICMLFIFLYASCSSEPPTGKTPAEILFKEGKSLKEDGQYTLAIQKLNDLRNRYPYSFFATPAELMQGDILFLQDSYVEASAAYMLFRDLHPKYVQLDYVIYKIAESYYKQIPDTFDRDLSSGEEAIKYFNELLTKYPSSLHIKNSKEKIALIQKKMLSKERYIADFYFTTEVYEASKWRYLDILERYKDRSLRDHAIVRAMKSAYFLKNYKDCLGIAKKFRAEVLKNNSASFFKIEKKCSKQA